MNLIQSLFVRGAQEAGELVGVFAALAAMGPKAMDQSAPPAAAAAPVEGEQPGVGAEDGEEGGDVGQPLVLKAIKEMNEILAAVELLRDRGVPLAGIGDPVAVGEAKNMIIKGMEAAMQSGQLVLTDDDKNPRPEGVNAPGAGLPEGEAGDGDGQGQGDYDDSSASGAAEGDEAGDTSGGGEGEGEEGEGDGTDGSGGDGDAGDGGDGIEGDGDADAGDGSDSDGSDGEEGDGDEEGDSDEEESDDDEEEEDEPGSNDV